MKGEEVALRKKLTISFLLISSGLLIISLPFIFLTAPSSAGEPLTPNVLSRPRLLFPPSGIATVPFTFDQAKILIPVWVDKKYLFMMHVDNAWSTTTFTKESIEMTPIQLGDLMEVPVMGIGGRSYIRGKSIIIGHLQIGELALENHRVVVLDWNDYPADGIIACDILYGMVITVDYDNRQISFARAEPEASLNPGANIREIIPFSIIPWETIRGGKVILPVRLEGANSLEGRIDLGSGQTIISWQAAKELGISRFNPRLKRGRTLRGGDGRPVRSYVWEFSYFQIGSITIERPLKIYIADLEIFEERPVILIGNDILQHLGKFTLNCGKQQLIVYQ